MMLQWACLFLAVLIILPLVRVIALGDVTTPLSERMSQFFVEGAVLLIVFMLLVPYFAYDSFKMTNRFAGPMYRLHQTFRSHLAGEPFRPIKFRDGDYWQQVAEDFNQMMARLEEEAAGEAPEADAERELVESA